MKVDLAAARKYLLDEMVDIYFSQKGDSRIVGGLTSRIERIICRKMGISEDEFRELIGNPFYRRALFIAAKSVAKYGVTKPQKLVSPLLIVWNFTNHCNLRCKHCYQVAGRRLENELTLEEKLDVVHQLASMGVVYLAFSGGEPLMSKDLYVVGREASNLGIYTSIATNGTLLTEENVKKIAEAGFKYIQVSVDGSNAETHDTFRGVRGCWEKTIRGIKNAKEKGLTVSIATTVTTHNYHQFDEILRMAKKLGVDKLTIYNFIPTGRGKDIMEDDLPPDLREEVLLKAQRELDRGFDVLTTAPQFSRVCIEAHGARVGVAHFGRLERDPDGRKAKFVAEFLGGCGAGRTYCAIQPDGKVTPCVFIPVVVGDLRKEDFKSIWDNSPLLESLRDRGDLTGYCGECEYRASCGGCRARALSYFNDLKAPDVGCILNREIWEESKRKVGEEVGRCPSAIYAGEKLISSTHA